MRRLQEHPKCQARHLWLVSDRLEGRRFPNRRFQILQQDRMTAGAHLQGVLAAPVRIAGLVGDGLVRKKPSGE